MGVTGSGPSCIELVVSTWPTGSSRSFLSSLSPVYVIRFVNVIEKKTLSVPPPRVHARSGALLL